MMGRCLSEFYESKLPFPLLILFISYSMSYMSPNFCLFSFIELIRSKPSYLRAHINGVRAGETRGTRGDRGPVPTGPINFISWEGPRRPGIFKTGPFARQCAVFLGNLLFLHTLCELFWRLGPFPVRAPRPGPPPPPNSFLRA